MDNVSMVQMIKSDKPKSFWQSLRMRLFPRRGTASRIFLEIDYYRLQGLLTKQHHDKYRALSVQFRRLRQLLDGGLLYPCKKVPDNLITMNSVIRLRSRRGTEFTVCLVYPREADKSQRKRSVLSPLGLALIGKTEGEMMRPSMTIEKILYQPESVGNYYQ